MRCASCSSTEPTEIWSEVARALGDVGTPAVTPLGRLVREVDLDERDRIVEALAHVAARAGHGARAAVEALAGGRDTLVATSAQRALARVAEVRAADAELRQSQQEGTVVRGFSRRFYDVLGGASGDTGAIELSADELEAVEEDEVSEFEGDDDEIVTHTNIPVLSGESTSPTPQVDLAAEAGVEITIEDRAVMRIGIFSDTHSNLEALTAVLGAFKHESVDKLVCLGDTVGYGASPNECCDLVREVAAFTILGNHDAAVAGRMDYSYYYDAARQALDLHASMLVARQHEVAADAAVRGARGRAESATARQGPRDLVLPRLADQHRRVRVHLRARAGGALPARAGTGWRT